MPAAPQHLAQIAGVCDVIHAPDEAVQATVTRFLANLQAHFAGRPVLSPV